MEAFMETSYPAIVISRLVRMYPATGQTGLPQQSDKS